MSARLRHIALSVADPAESAKFFCDSFGFKSVGEYPNKVYLTDGTMNLALIRFEGQVPGFTSKEKFFGIAHFGMWVDDLEEAKRNVEAAGGKYLTGAPPADSTALYEVKYTGPHGVVFDVTHSGWVGAVKEVLPGADG
jgi:lactoylglutathione lyase